MAEDKKDKDSTGLKLKKYWASKTAENSVGRKAITQLIGDQGTALLHALKSAATKDQGEKRGKELKQAILKLALKAKLLYDEGKISTDQLMELVKPINEMTTKLHENLHGNTVDKLQVELLSAKFSLVEEAVVKILVPLIKEKNVQLFREVAQYYGSKRFLELILGNKDYDEEKQLIRQAIDALAQPLLDQYGSSEEYCKRKRCEETAIAPQGPPTNFPGSVYCVKHHTELWETLAANEPSLAYFLTDDLGKADGVFQREVVGSFPPNYANFYVAVINYKTTAINLRLTFAEAVVEKYFLEKKKKKNQFRLDLAPDHCDGLTAALAKCRQAAASKPLPSNSSTSSSTSSSSSSTSSSGSSGSEGSDGSVPSAELFDEAFARVRRVLEVVFGERYVAPGHWAAYLKATKLPAHLADLDE